MEKLKFKKAIYKPQLELIKVSRQPKLEHGMSVSLVFYDGDDDTWLVRLPRKLWGAGHDNSHLSKGPDFKAHNYWWIATCDLEVIEDEV
jgi:hypothetical protein